MLSDEEKKAVEWFREDLAEEKENCGKYNDYKKQVIKRNEKIFNLIEKQQKEIEELKEKIKTFKIEDENIYLQFGEITEKKRWQYKIKAKIEEYKKQQKEEPDAYLCIKALSSLLEKE